MNEEIEHLREIIKKHQDADAKNIRELKTHLLNAIHLLSETSIALHNQLFTLESEIESHKFDKTN